MKKAIFLGGLLLVLSGCAPANNDQAAQTPPSADGNPTVVCPEGQYACACATGSYCLRMGAMCLNPSSPCPVL